MVRKKIIVGSELNGGSLATKVAQISPSQREQMIAYAAYFRAEKRGFSPDDDQADWFEAEREIGRNLDSFSS
ncbi:MAG: DUF2934 domain-containing protein [Gallionellaceae bacterium]|nr:DUF2934 domain-containing protein [Gallionellaceae bacterium]